MTSRREVDRSRIIFEQFDNETVLVNTESGVFYSLNPTATAVLKLIEEGCPPDQLTAVLFPGNSAPPQAAPAIHSFLQQLAAESILRDRSASNPIAPIPTPDPALFSAASAFLPPLLERFDYMASLMQLDPIHEVDPTFGWPKESRDNDADSQPA